TGLPPHEVADRGARERIAGGRARHSQPALTPMARRAAAAVESIRGEYRRLRCNWTSAHAGFGMAGLALDIAGVGLAAGAEVASSERAHALQGDCQARPGNPRA